MPFSLVWVLEDTDLLYMDSELEKYEGSLNEFLNLTRVRLSLLYDRKSIRKRADGYPGGYPGSGSD